MQRRVRITPWLTGLAMLGWILHAAGTANAAGVKVSGGGIKPLGDPYYYYIVEINLDPGFQFEAGDSVTLDSVAGIQYPNSPTITPNPGDPVGPWATDITNVASGPLPNYSPTTIVPMANVEFISAAPTVTNPGPGEVYLGQFEVLTAVSLPQLPANYTVDIDWTASLHNLEGQAVTDSGVVVLSIVPEPSSMILLGLGVSLPIFWQVWKRRQVGQSKQV